MIPLFILGSVLMLVFFFLQLIIFVFAKLGHNRLTLNPISRHDYISLRALSWPCTDFSHFEGPNTMSTFHMATSSFSPPPPPPVLQPQLVPLQLPLQLAPPSGNNRHYRTLVVKNVLDLSFQGDRQLVVRGGRNVTPTSVGPDTLHVDGGGERQSMDDECRVITVTMPFCLTGVFLINSTVHLNNSSVLAHNQTIAVHMIRSRLWAMVEFHKMDVRLAEESHIVGQPPGCSGNTLTIEFCGRGNSAQRIRVDGQLTLKTDSPGNSAELLSLRNGGQLFCDHQSLRLLFPAAVSSSSPQQTSPFRPSPQSRSNTYPPRSGNNNNTFVVPGLPQFEHLMQLATANYPLLGDVATAAPPPPLPPSPPPPPPPPAPPAPPAMPRLPPAFQPPLLWEFLTNSNDPGTSFQYSNNNNNRQPVHAPAARIHIPEVPAERRMPAAAERCSVCTSDDKADEPIYRALPCRHLICCKTCWNEHQQQVRVLARCPVCRDTIRRIEKIKDT